MKTEQTTFLIGIKRVIRPVCYSPHEKTIINTKASSYGVGMNNSIILSIDDICHIRVYKDLLMFKINIEIKSFTN